MRKILWTFILLGVLFIAADEMRYTPTLTSFNNGQVSPLIEARTDFDKYKSSCRRLENMFVTAQGPVTRRSGTKYICDVKDSNYPTRLLSFEFSTEDKYVIEGGSEYFRFLRDGGQILFPLGVEDYSALSVVSNWLLNENDADTTVIDAQGANDGASTVNTSEIHSEDGLNGCFDLIGEEWVTVSDDASLSFTDDSDDSPFSITGWVYVTDGDEKQIIVSKWKQDTAREYRFYLDENEKLCLDLHDDTVDLTGFVVAQWKCNDDAASPLVDETTESHDANVVNAAGTVNTSVVADTGILTGAFNLNNAYGFYAPDHNDFSFTNGSNVDEPFSISAWVYLTDFSSISVIASRYSMSSTDYREYIFWVDTSGYLIAQLWDESASTFTPATIQSISTDAIPLNTWILVTMTYDGSENSSGLNLYVNSTLISQTRTKTDAYSGMENLAVHFRVGCYHNSSAVVDGFLNGKVDNVIIFNTELSSSVVTSLWNSGVGTEDLSGAGIVQRISDDSVSTGWHYIAATYSAPSDPNIAADGITLYVDGKEIASTAYNNSEYTAMQSTAIDFRIGAQINTADAGQYIYDSKIDNVAIYDVNLTAAEVASLYDDIPYEIETPYDANEVWNLKYAQVDNQMYIVDGNHIPKKLTRINHTNWLLEDFEYTTGPFMAENKDTSITITPPSENPDLCTAAQAISKNSDATDDKAFDDSFAYADAWDSVATTDEWVGQNFGSPRTIKRVTIYPCYRDDSYADTTPKHIRIDASADGVTWTNISINKWYGRCESYLGDEAYVDNIKVSTEYIDLWLDNDTAYQYWRVFCYDNWGDATDIRILEIEMREEESGVYTASSNIFNSGHEGSIWRINQDRGTSILKGTIPSGLINADGTYISDTTDWFVGGYSFVTTNASPVFTVTLQRSTNYGATWQSALTPVSNADFDNPAETEKTGAIYRVKISNYTSGTCNFTLTITDQTNRGIIRIDSVGSPTSVTATTLVPLVHSDPTMTWSEGYWSNYRGWPKTVETHQERLVFGGSKSFPQTLWFGRANPDNYEDFTEGALDDDAFTVALPGQNPIQWVSSRDYLMIGTSGSVGKWGEQGKPVTPTSPSYQEQSRVGSSNLMNVLASDALLYVERGATKVREFVYSLQHDKYMSPDLTLLSENILESGVKDLAFQERPEPILWCVKNNGDIATMTYQREQSITGWAIHNTDGDFESIARIPGATSEDEVWVTVARDINSVTKRYIEQFQPRDWGTDINDCWFVDCGLSYDGVDGNNFDGLDHLEGLRLSILGDGVIEPNEVVTSGEITIDRDAGRVTVGLPFTSVVETLPLYLDEQDKAHNKKVTTLGLDLYETGYCKYGVGTDSTLMNINFENDMNTDPNATAQDLYTSVYKLMGVRCPWGSLQKNTIRLESDAPLPLTLRSISLDLRIYPPQ